MTTGRSSVGRCRSTPSYCSRSKKPARAGDSRSIAIVGRRAIRSCANRARRRRDQTETPGALRARGRSGPPTPRSSGHARAHTAAAAAARRRGSDHRRARIRAFERAGAALLFKLITDRYERRAAVMTTGKFFDDSSHCATDQPLSMPRQPLDRDIVAEMCRDFDLTKAEAPQLMLARSMSGSRRFIRTPQAHAPCSYGWTRYGRIISLSSCSRMWQCHT